MKVYREWVVFIIAVLAFAGSSVEGAVSLDGEEIVFSLLVPSGASVYLVGDFNGWNPTIDKMVWNNERYEIRLFLLPGKHRYVYVVDGESRPDTDNLCKDEKGNSCFYFSEVNGKYTLRFSGEFRVKSQKKSLNTDLSTEIMSVFDKDCFMTFLKGDFDGNIAGTTRLRLSSALLWDSDRLYGSAGPVLLRSEALSEVGRWKVRAFYRMGELGFNDPLELIGVIGPFDYPLGLFCRGIDIDVAVTEQFSGRVFYAGRLEGYRSGLEIGEYDSLYNDQLQFGNRDLRDSDIIGATLGGRIAGINLRYLFRHDKRYAEWGFPRNEMESFSSGTEVVNIHGVLCVCKPCDSTLIELEYLSGKTCLSETEKLLGLDEACDLNGGIGESGWKMYAGIERSFTVADLEFFYSCQRRNGISKENEGVESGLRQTVGFDAGMKFFGFHWNVEGVSEDYSNISPDYFWLQRKNFWLEGDRIDSNRLLFLRSSGVYKARVGVRKINPGNRISYYQDGLDISLLFMCERDDFSNRVTEMKIKHSIPIGSLLPFKLVENNSLFNGVDILADVRSALYNNRNWSGKRAFIDPFIALRKRFTDSSWCMVGIGLNPYVFDKWHYNITYDGREKFLEDKGVFRESIFLNQVGLLEILSKAEEEMSESWIISFEASLGF
ncbi:glycogen-binding domain-containing protein [bacterium]|nr:glycogen-binding domain-containing protein [bacterium]